MRWSVGSQLPCLGGGGLEEWLGMGGGWGDGPVDTAVLGDVVVVAVLMGHDGGFGAGGLEGGIQGGGGEWKRGWVLQGFKDVRDILTLGRLTVVERAVRGS